MNTYVAVYFGTVLIAMFLVPVMSRIAKKYRLVDVPGPRKVHKTIIPRIGGIAFLVASVLMLPNLTYTSVHDWIVRPVPAVGMGLFVWLPVALHPAPRSALLISYGLGNTARALCATAGLERVEETEDRDGSVGRGRQVERRGEERGRFHAAKSVAPQAPPP